MTLRENVLRGTMWKSTIFSTLLLSFSLITVQCQFIINRVDEEKLVKESLPLLLKFLNDDVQSKIDYDSGEISRSQWKGDMLEVDFKLCKSSLNSEECGIYKAGCKGMLYASPKSGLQVVSLSCVPNEDRNVIGGVYDVNVNASGIDSLVKTIIQHVESEENKEYIPVEVLKVQQQIVYGYNTFVMLKIAQADSCSDSGCDLILYCNVQFYKKPGYGESHVIKSNNCTKSQQFISPNFNNNFVQKPERNENDMLSDLMSQIIPKEKNIESSSIHNLVDENGQPIVISSTLIQEVVATEDEPISIGTENGFTQNSKGDDEVTSQNTPDSIHPEIEKSRRKRALVGGKTSMNLNDPKIEQLLNASMNHLNGLGSNKNYQIAKVISATSQVVQGISYDIKVEITNNNCELEKNALSDCPSSKEICNINIWSRLWLNSEIVKINCGSGPEIKFNALSDKNKKDRRKRSVGAPVPISKDDQRIMEHLYKLLPKLDANSEVPHKLKVRKVISAAKQIVAGTYWNINAEIMSSNCLKADKKQNEDCGEPDATPFVTICNFKFWEKLPNKEGIREYENVEVKCDEPTLNLNRPKRQLPGGFYEVDTKDERILKHLSDILPKLEASSGNSNNMKITEVLSAKSQVVAGTNWEIKAKVTSGAESTICTFKFWEKLPDKNRVRHLENVKVECDEQKFKLRTRREVKENDLIYEYLTKSLQHIDLNSPEEYKYKIKEVISVERGDHLAIKTLLILSDCEKNDVMDWDQCGELQGVEPKTCLIKIRDNQIHIKCENQKHEYTFRTKRSLKYLQQFEQFLEKHKKIYKNPKEFAFRFSVFEENMKYVKFLNQYEKGTAVYGPTEFADLTREEFKHRLGYRPDLRNENECEFTQAEIPDISVPKSFDWRDKNAVTNVKNQGSCGSCWAFSTTGNIEGLYAIQYKKLMEFSEQELVDCDTVDQGCNGGLMDNAYRQIEKLGGLETESDYPYDAKNEQCHFNRTKVKVELSGALNISTNEDDMVKWLVQNGPISIAINANAMQFYMGGVSHPWKFVCSPKSLDHGVLIVGYGVHTYPKFKKTLPYWIVKNSWGKSWGEQGYYRVYRGDGTCGVNQTPSSAILK